MHQKPFNPLGFGDAERYEQVFKRIADGSIIGVTNEELIEAARSLATYHFNHVGQDQEAAALLIHSMLLERTVRDMEKTMIKIDQSNAATQRLVVILTVVALGIGVLQVIVGILPLLCASAR